MCNISHILFTNVIQNYDIKITQKEKKKNKFRIKHCNINTKQHNKITTNIGPNTPSWLISFSSIQGRGALRLPSVSRTSPYVMSQEQL